MKIRDVRTIGLRMPLPRAFEEETECFPSPDRDPLWASLMLNRPPIRDGLIALPAGPGFGLEFIPDVVAKCRVVD